MTNTTTTPCSCGCSQAASVFSPDEIQHILAAADPSALDAALTEKLSALRRETVSKPTIYIGMGTCGLGAGAAKTRKAAAAWLEARQIDGEIVEVGCIGLCSAEPILDIQLPGRARVSFANVTERDAPALLESVFDGTIPDNTVIGQFNGATNQPWDKVPALKDHPFFAPQTRFVLAQCGEIDPSSMDEYIAHGGYATLARMLRDMTPDAVCDAVEQSGLRGRGGGGFPTGRKWELTRVQPGDEKYVICNGDEGDPGAFMDRSVMEGNPHAVIEGMLIAARAIGAHAGYVYVRMEYPLAVKRLYRAVEDARAFGVLGSDIFGSGFEFNLNIMEGAGAFVCGEETALIASIEGRRGMPMPKPPFPAQSGLWGKPTVINNVETLAAVPIILRNGPEAFRARGTEKSPGTKTFALTGHVANTGLIEVPFGATLNEIVYEIGGGVTDNAGNPTDEPFKAVQIGGPSGGCIPESHLDVSVDYESLKELGAMMGSGGLVVMDDQTCMVDVAKFFMDFIQRESCGKCIPCREGTRRMLEILTRITHGHRHEAGADALVRFQGIMYLTRLAEVIRSTSLCGLGQTAPNPVLSTLRWFRNEYEAHIYERRCPSGVCTELLHYKIDTQKCIGCTLCARKCPAEAIMGAPKSPHYVIQDKCIGCGACLEACKFDAVFTE